MKNKTIDIEQLYDEYYNDIYGFAFWLCGSEEDAKDIASETFVRLLTASSKLKAETIKGYLLAIARNIYLQGIRRGNKQVPLEKNLIDTAPNLDVQAASQSELKQTVRALQDLNELDKTVMLMRAYEGLSYSEISLLLQIPVASLKVRVCRTRKKINQILNN